MGRWGEDGPTEAQSLCLFSSPRFRKCTQEPHVPFESALVLEAHAQEAQGWSTVWEP